MMTGYGRKREMLRHAEPPLAERQRAETRLAELRHRLWEHMLVGTSIATAMAMPSLLPSYTIDDLERFPGDGNRYELVEGFLLVTPAPESPHQVVQSRLARELMLRFGREIPALVLTPGVVQVAPATQMEPDILVVPDDGTMPRKWLQLRDLWLAVEISGRGSRIYDRDFKGPAYMRAGVKTYWRIDLRDRCLYVSVPGQPAEVRHTDEVRWQPPVGPDAPLVVDIRELLRGVTGDDA